MNNPQQFLFPRLSPVLRCSSYGKRNEYILIFSSNSKRLYFTIWLLNTFADLLTSKIFENGQKYLFHIICNILYWIISFGIRFWNYIIDYMMIFSRVSIACKLYWIKILLYRSLSVVREKSSSPKLGRVVDSLESHPCVRLFTRNRVAFFGEFSNVYHYIAIACI